jgi:hypothetical protein
MQVKNSEMPGAQLLRRLHREEQLRKEPFQEGFFYERIRDG